MFSATTGAVLGGPPPRPLPQVVLERRGDEIVATGFVKVS
jgi:Rieske Fe-S protein